MLDEPIHLTRRPKRGAPPLVGPDGEPLATIPPGRSWYRLSLSISLVPPKSGQVFSIDSTPTTRRLVIYAPRAVVVTLTMALLGSVPWLQHLVLWLVTHWHI